MLKNSMKHLLSLVLIMFLVQCEGTVNNLPEKAAATI